MKKHENFLVKETWRASDGEF